MLTSVQQLTLASDMEKWYVAVADYACKTSKGIKTKNNIGCLEAQLEIIAALYNNISTPDLSSFQYPIYQICSDNIETLTPTITEPLPNLFNYSYAANSASGYIYLVIDGVNTLIGSAYGNESLKTLISTYITDYAIDADYVSLGAGLGFVLGSIEVTFGNITVITNVCNTQAQNGALTQANIVCLLAKLTEGTAEGTGRNVTPNYIMWGTDMVNDILDYGSSSNQHIKWRF